MSVITGKYLLNCPEFGELRSFEININRQTGAEDKFMGDRVCEDEEFCKRANRNGGLCPVRAKLIEEKFGLRIL